ncbi:murein transglycosylase A [Marivivens marinus]|uniref:murein transglycosylase A n=1 Tax=Marivivens marinus TaxID=3110173 RepID=UPI003B845F58
MTAVRYHVLKFSDLTGWAADDHAAALEAFARTSDVLTGPDWAEAVREMRTGGTARDCLENALCPILIDDGNPAHFTGYYEPELSGSPVRTADLSHPIHALPRDLPDGPWLTRQEIEEGDALTGHELLWLADPVDRFFLQVQGSGRIRFPDGAVVRVGYAGRNGHPYASVGQELVQRGIFTADQVSAQAIKDWVRARPDEGQRLLWHNPSYVFFRLLEGIDPDDGPIGALGKPVTGGRTVAVDPDYVPLGAPVWIETQGKDAMNRLMVAQDVGSAIKGAQRADIFFGTGDAAGLAAGRTNAGGRMVVLLPRAMAARIAEGLD